jgi:Uma2 family endonuclease
MSILTTRRDYEALPEGAPFELCDGLLAKQPSPRFGHQRIQMEILRRLYDVVEPVRVAAGPVDVLVDELNVFVPDVVVLDDVPADDAAYVGVPRVVVEILSPSTRERDRDYKARRYLGLGVREVWLVDRERASIEVVDLEGGREATARRPARSRAIEGFALVPEELFARRR